MRALARASVLSLDLSFRETQPSFHGPVVAQTPAERVGSNPLLLPDDLKKAEPINVFFGLRR
jgi:hypothetical protein